MAKVAYYKGMGATLKDKIMTLGVRIWTLGKYSHCELIDTNGQDNNPDVWQWYSASAFSEGIVRKKNITINESNWDIFDLPEFNEDEAFSAIAKEFGKKYDWTGIFLSQFLPLGRHSKNKWFCSEIVKKGMYEGGLLGGFDNHHAYSPNKLFRTQNRLGQLTKWHR